MRGLAKEAIHYTDLPNVETDPEEINKASIALAFVEDFEVKKNEGAKISEDVTSEEPKDDLNIINVQYGPLGGQ